MEAISAMLILIPILVPVGMALGIDPIQFGLVMVLTLMIGTITRAQWESCSSSRRGWRTCRSRRSARPRCHCLIPLLAVLLAIILWPPLTTWLPSLMQ